MNDPKIKSKFLNIYDQVAWCSFIYVVLLVFFRLGILIALPIGTIIRFIKFEAVGFWTGFSICLDKIWRATSDISARFRASTNSSLNIWFSLLATASSSDKAELLSREPLSISILVHSLGVYINQKNLITKLNTFVSASKSDKLLVHSYFSVIILWL